MDVAKSRHTPDRAHDAVDARKIRMFNGLNRSGQAQGGDGPAVAMQEARAALGASTGAPRIGNLGFDFFSTTGI
jgi:hypothetical protein